MNKLLEKVQQAQAYSSMAGGLGLAKTICRRKLLEADPCSTGQANLILDIIKDIDKLLDYADSQINAPFV